MFAHLYETYHIVSHLLSNAMRSSDAVQLLTPARHCGPGRKRLRITTGFRYPQPSARQQARYARQTHAGQLDMDGCRRARATP
ncbi:hypothetical protein FB480_101887 [Agrobacterium vitis]|nr:hypothetical protein FB480_101887 [Agrobacterium vitis]